MVPSEGHSHHVKSATRPILKAQTAMQTATTKIPSWTALSHCNPYRSMRSWSLALSKGTLISSILRFISETARFRGLHVGSYAVWSGVKWCRSKLVDVYLASCTFIYFIYIYMQCWESHTRYNLNTSCNSPIRSKADPYTAVSSVWAVQDVLSEPVPDQHAAFQPTLDTNCAIRFRWVKRTGWIWIWSVMQSAATSIDIDDISLISSNTS